MKSATERILLPTSTIHLFPVIPVHVPVDLHDTRIFYLQVWKKQLRYIVVLPVLNTVFPLDQNNHVTGCQKCMSHSRDISRPDDIMRTVAHPPIHPQTYPFKLLYCWGILLNSLKCCLQVPFEKKY